MNVISLGVHGSITLACPARLHPICVRVEALQAAFRSARRTRGRLTGQSSITPFGIRTVLQIQNHATHGTINEYLSSLVQC